MHLQQLRTMRMKTEIIDESQLKALSNLMQITIQQERYIYILHK